MTTLRGHGPAGRGPCRARAGGARLPRRLHRRRPRDADPRARPADDRGHGRRADRGAAGPPAEREPRRGCCRGRRLAVRRDGRRHPGRGRGGGAGGRRGDAGGRRRSSSATRRRSGRCGGSARTARASSPASPDGDEAWPGWEDAAVPPERFGAYLREFDALLRTARPPRRLLRPLRRRLPARPDRLRPAHDAAGVADFRSFMEDAADLAVAHGGSLSGEHGDGRGPRRAAAAHVPAGDHRRVRRVQGHLGPGRQDEPRPGRAAREAGRGPAGVRRAAHAARTAGARVHRGPRLVHPGQPPLPRRRAGASRRPAA